MLLQERSKCHRAWHKMLCVYVEFCLVLIICYRSDYRTNLSISNTLSDFRVGPNLHTSALKLLINVKGNCNILASTKAFPVRKVKLVLFFRFLPAKKSSLLIWVLRYVETFRSRDDSRAFEQVIGKLTHGAACL